MAQREAGFYWVRRQDRDWEVAEWALPEFGEDLPPNWWCAGEEVNFTDQVFAEIGEQVARCPAASWPLAKPITAAQRNGEPILGWYRARKCWLVVAWRAQGPNVPDNERGYWQPHSGVALMPAEIALYLPLPPDVQDVAAQEDAGALPIPDSASSPDPDYGV